MTRPRRYVPLPCAATEMSGAELRVYLAGCPREVVLRSLLLNEYQRLQTSGERPRPRTLRGLWYQVIKPVLSRLELVDEDASEQDLDTLLSGCLKDLLEMEDIVLEGVAEVAISYRALGVVDGSCHWRVATPSIDPVVAPHGVGARLPGVILFLEKESLWPHLEELAGFYGVSALSGGGLPGFAAVEDLLSAIADVEGRESSEVLILAVTDYDPEGYDLVETVRAEAEVLAPRTGLGPVEIVRLGVEPWQVDNLAINSYRLKESLATRSQVMRWMQATGGVDGQFLGIELDALPVDRLRALFIEGLADVVPESDFIADAVRLAAEKVAFARLQVGVDRALGKARQAVSGLVPEPRASAHDLAREGSSSPDPSRLLSPETMSEIERLVMTALDELEG